MALDEHDMADILAAVGEVLGEGLSQMRGEVRGEMQRLRDEVTGVLVGMQESITTLSNNDRALADRIAAGARALDGGRVLKPKS